MSEPAMQAAREHALQAFPIERSREIFSYSDLIELLREAFMAGAAWQAQQLREESERWASGQGTERRERERP